MKFRFFLVAFSIVCFSQLAFGQSEPVTEEVQEVEELKVDTRNSDELKLFIDQYQEALNVDKGKDGVNVEAKNEHLKEMIAEWETLSGKKWVVTDKKDQD